MLLDQKDKTIVQGIINDLQKFKSLIENPSDETYEEYGNWLRDSEKKFFSTVAPIWVAVDNLLNGEDSRFIDHINGILSKLGTDIKWGPDWLEDEEVFEDLPEEFEDLSEESINEFIKELKQLEKLPKLTSSKRKALKNYRDALRQHANFIDLIIGE